MISVRGILEALWIAVLICGILVPIVAGCMTVPKFKGEIHVEFDEGKEEDSDEPESRE